MAKLIPIRPPLRGLNTLDPFIEFESGYARELTNYSIYNGRLKQRPSVRQVTDPSLFSNILHWFNGDYGIGLSSGTIYRLSDGTSPGNIGGSCHEHATTVKHASIELLFGCRQPRALTGPGFTAWGFTTAAVTATAITCGVSHNGRLFVAAGSVIEYSDVAQITGAMPAGNSRDYVDLLAGQTILRMFSVTAQPGNQTQNVFVIFGSGGRVLVFQGDYPKALNWSLIGKFDMPAPANCVSFVEIDGDIWVSTSKYAYWFRDLFTGGAQTAWENSPTRPIETLWQAVSWFDQSSAALPEAPHSFYVGTCANVDVDAIVCQCSDLTGLAASLGSIANYGNEACYFAYFRKYKAWALWLMAPFFTPVRETSPGVFEGCDYTTGTKVLSPHNMQDHASSGSATPTEYSIETSWKTPYFEAFGGRVQKLTGVRPYYRNTISGYFDKVRAIFDYSDLNAPWGFFTQSTVTQIDPGNSVEGSLDLPNNTWDTFSGFVPIGGMGGTMSLQFTQRPQSGTEDTGQIHDMVAAAAYVEDGGPMIGG